MLHRHGDLVLAVDGTLCGCLAVDHCLHALLCGAELISEAGSTTPEALPAISPPARSWGEPLWATESVE